MLKKNQSNLLELPWKAEILQLVVGWGGGRRRAGRPGDALRRVPQGPALQQAGQPVERALGRINKGLANHII